MTDISNKTLLFQLNENKDFLLKLVLYVSYLYPLHCCIITLFDYNSLLYIPYISNLTLLLFFIVNLTFDHHRNYRSRRIRGRDLG